MPDKAELSPTERLLALWEYLGVRRTHVATPIPGDLAPLAADHGARLAGVVLCVPSRLDPEPFAELAERVLLIGAEHGPSAEATARAAAALPSATRVMLAGYQAPGSWADAVADRGREIVPAMIDFLGRIAAAENTADAPRPVAAEGIHAGITYRIRGTGPTLVLLPFFLAPSQWEPAIAALARHFSVVTVGGPHLGGVASLEDRAKNHSYQAMFHALVDRIAPRPGEAILEVGCGAGSLVRLLAKRLGGANPLTAADVNPFLLREAAALAAADGVAQAIHFTNGNAEALPFPEAAFDCVYSVTVLEECDAGRAIAEIHRVLRPGGRAGIAVRALDMKQWWNLDLPVSIWRKVDTPPYSVAPTGVADRSLYRRMRQAGFADLACFPTLVTLDRPGGPIWRNREDHVLSLLTPEERAQWQSERQRAAADGLLFMAHPLHCAVGTKPAAPAQA
ncbi:MAG TPA: methyltransferase domain-containing protein [Stellaceae bacterium]|nr:methyltransferase domain-containing protein [Stellaceae bacterium]